MHTLTPSTIIASRGGENCLRADRQLLTIDNSLQCTINYCETYYMVSARPSPFLELGEGSTGGD